MKIKIDEVTDNKLRIRRPQEAADIESLVKAKIK